MTLATGSAGWWPGGRLVVDLQNARGGDISADLGDRQGASNIAGPPGSRFVEYYLEQTLVDGSGPEPGDEQLQLLGHLG